MYMDQLVSIVKSAAKDADENDLVDVCVRVRTDSGELFECCDFAIVAERDVVTNRLTIVLVAPREG